MYRGTTNGCEPGSKVLWAAAVRGEQAGEQMWQGNDAATTRAGSPTPPRRKGKRVAAGFNEVVGDVSAVTTRCDTTTPTHTTEGGCVLDRCFRQGQMAGSVCVLPRQVLVDKSAVPTTFVVPIPGAGRQPNWVTRNVGGNVDVWHVP